MRSLIELREECSDVALDAWMEKIVVEELEARQLPRVEESSLRAGNKL